MDGPDLGNLVRKTGRSFELGSQEGHNSFLTYPFQYFWTFHQGSTDRKVVPGGLILITSGNQVWNQQYPEVNLISELNWRFCQISWPQLRLNLNLTPFIMFSFLEIFMVLSTRFKRPFKKILFDDFVIFTQFFLFLGQVHDLRAPQRLQNSSFCRHKAYYFKRLF